MDQKQLQLILSQAETDRLGSHIWDSFIGAQMNHNRRIERFRRYCGKLEKGSVASKREARKMRDWAMKYVQVQTVMDAAAEEPAKQEYHD